MSRLDDELKVAFKRREPSPDFTARLLERINSSPPSKPSFWQRLQALFEGPKLRWVAAGAIAALVVVISAAAYRGTHQTGVEENGRIVAAASATNAPDAAAGRSGAWVDQAPKITVIKQPDAGNGGRRLAQTHGGAVTVAVRKEPRPSPAAEAAKERVLFALQIASDTLNDAQKAIQDDGPQEKPEPLHNK